MFGIGQHASRTVVAAAALIAAVALLSAVTVTAVPPAVLQLESQFGSAPWTPRGSLTVRGPNKIAFDAAAGAALLSKDELQSLKAAAVVRVRVGDATLLMSRCFLLADFEARSAELLVLHLSLRAAVGNGGEVLGLHREGKLDPPTTAECDTSVLDLFQQVELQIKVEPLRARVPAPAQPNYAETALHPQREQAAAGAAGAGQKKKGDSEQPEEDNRTFIEKYWLYIAIFVGWTLLQAVIAPPPKEGEGGAGKVKAA